MTHNERMTITEVAQKIGVVPRTIVRWENSGKVSKAKRDWRGWRVYSEKELDELQNFVETLYEKA